MARIRLFHSLGVRNFAQIAHADVRLGDLSVLVGPQASGKSLALQLMKLCRDGQRITRILLENGFGWNGSPQGFAERVFGEGMGHAWSKRTSVFLNDVALDLEALAGDARKLQTPQEVFYVPAQRALTVIDGWPLSFPQGPLGTPFVVRQFSEELAVLLRGVGSGGRIFPLESKLKGGLRRVIDDAFFHGAKLDLSTIRGRTELRLVQGTAELPAIAWTAGQREFVPLLVALYSLLPAGKRKRDPKWIVLEEPEMGLHPQGILAAMLLAFELLARGYRIVLSTHHPLVLDILWGITRLQQRKSVRGTAGKVLRMFGAGADLLPIAQAALKKNYTITYFGFGSDGRVVTTDISTLDPASNDPIVQGWGGLSGLSGRIGDIVAEAVE